MDRYNVGREIVNHPTEDPSGIIPQVTLRGPGLGRLARQLLGRKVQNGVGHVHQRLVEPRLRTVLDIALTGVLEVRVQELLLALDSPDGSSSLSLPVFGDMQDMLHEDIDVNEDPVALEVLDDILFILGAVELFRLLRGAYQLL